MLHNFIVSRRYEYKIYVRSTFMTLQVSSLQGFKNFVSFYEAKPSLRFAIWAFTFLGLFLVSNISFYMYEGNAQHTRDFDEAARTTEMRLKSVQSKLSFIDKRLMQAQTKAFKLRILQDRYALKVGNDLAANVLSLYLQFRKVCKVRRPLALLVRLNLKIYLL